MPLVRFQYFLARPVKAQPLQPPRARRPLLLRPLWRQFSFVSVYRRSNGLASPLLSPVPGALLTMANSAVRKARDDEVQHLFALAFRSKAHWGYDETFMAASRAELTVSSGGLARCPTFVYDDGTVHGFY